MNDELRIYKEFGLELVEKSALLINKYFRTNIKIENKNDLSPVTIADKNTEKMMRKMIMKDFPDHGIIGEEYGEYNPKAVYKWVIDPIDGTKSFISGTPLFGTLVALTKNEYPILGIINLPVLGETLVGDNRKTELNGVEVNFRPCNSISTSLLLTTDVKNISEYRDLDKFNSLAGQVKMFRTWGDCYGYYLLATGYADIMVDPIMSAWDLLALIPIIKGAGGIITDYNGNDPLCGNSIVAAAKNLHTEVIKILNGK
jgi:histidinol phosphatase-like enzyme (inositol monophosphatase family)